MSNLTPAEAAEQQRDAIARYEAMPRGTALERATRHLARLQTMSPQVAEQKTPHTAALATAEATIASAEALTRIATSLELIIAAAPAAEQEPTS